MVLVLAYISDLGSGCVQHGNPTAWKHHVGTGVALKSRRALDRGVRRNAARQ